MNFFKGIKQELVDYGFIKDPAEKRRLEIIKEEKERAESLRRKEARHAYYTELIIQTAQNVGMIRAKLGVLQSNLNSLGKRGKKEERANLTKQIDWLKSKLKEEEFMLNHYKELRDGE